jgi:hypothetical protein
MKSIFLLSCLLLSNYLYAQITRPIGVNLTYVADYATELVFTNTFRQSREWISSNADNTGAWDTQISIPYRPDGYPLQIPYDNGTNPPQKVKTLLIWDLFSATPTGNFRLKSSGTGQIRLTNGANGTFTSPVDTIVNVTGGVILEITASNANDPVHDIQFILPDYVNSYQTKIFTDEMLDFLTDFQVIRCMEFTATNGSPIVSWADRTMPDFYTQGKNTGVAWNYVVQLANITQKDIWINIPHKADDAFIDSLAHYLQTYLNPTIRIYLEYSNEVWNSSFSQQADCAQMAQTLGYTGQQWELAWKYTAKRSADVFQIFEDVFANDDRLIKIIPSQAANSWLTNQLVLFFNDPQYNPNQITADAIAIGPYFGHSVANDIANAGLASIITVDAIIDSLESSLDEAHQWMLLNKAVADNHNLDLIVYEGGQHLVATGNNINNDTLTQKLIAANRHNAMQDLYCTYFNYWYNNIGSLFCHFSSTQRYTKWGSWGIKENQQDTLNPKYLGIKSCVFSYNDVSTTINSEVRIQSLTVHPNPMHDYLFIQHPQNVIPFFEIYGNLGQLLFSGYGDRVNLSDYPSGMYLIRSANQIQRFIKQ